MKIHVGRLSLETTELQLRKAFEEFGKLTSLDVAMDKAIGKLRRFAFVEMSSEEHAQKPITSLLGKDLTGSLLTVNGAKRN
jgi:RNA recognition motif-containing protein